MIDFNFGLTGSSEVNMFTFLDEANVDDFPVANRYMYSNINFENVAPSNNTHSNCSEVEFLNKNEAIHYDVDANNYEATNYESVNNCMHSNASCSNVDTNNYQAITHDSMNSNASCSNVDTNNYQAITHESMNSNASCSNVDTNNYQAITYDSMNSNASCSNVNTNNCQAITYDSMNSNNSCSNDGNNSEAFNYDLVNQILSPYGNVDDTINNGVGSDVENLQNSNNMSSYNLSFRALRTNSTAKTGNIAYHITSVKVNGNNGKGFLRYPKDFPYMFLII